MADKKERNYHHEWWLVPAALTALGICSIVSNTRTSTKSENNFAPIAPTAYAAEILPAVPAPPTDSVIAGIPDSALVCGVLNIGLPGVVVGRSAWDILTKLGESPTEIRSYPHVVILHREWGDRYVVAPNVNDEIYLYMHNGDEACKYSNPK